MNANIVINEKKIRTLLRKTENKFISKEVVSRILDLNKAKTTELLDYLDHQGYIEKSYIEGFWQHSIRGRLLINKKFNQEFKVETIRKQVTDLIERAKAVNSSNMYPDQVLCIKITSEYPIEHKSTGVHIAYALSRKNMTNTKYKEAAAKLRKESNKIFGDIVQKLYYPEEAIRIFLQSRSHVSKLRKFQKDEIGQIKGFIIFEERRILKLDKI